MLLMLNGCVVAVCFFVRINDQWFWELAFWES